MTYREVFAAVKGHRRRSEEAYKDRWEQTRMIAWAAVSPHMKNHMTMLRAYPMPWDPGYDHRSKEDKLKALMKGVKKWHGVDFKPAKIR